MARISCRSFESTIRAVCRRPPEWSRRGRNPAQSASAKCGSYQNDQQLSELVLGLLARTCAKDASRLQKPSGRGRRADSPAFLPTAASCCVHCRISDLLSSTTTTSARVCAPWTMDSSPGAKMRGERHCSSQHRSAARPATRQKPRPCPVPPLPVTRFLPVAGAAARSLLGAPPLQERLILISRHEPRVDLIAVPLPAETRPCHSSYIRSPKPTPPRQALHPFGPPSSPVLPPKGDYRPVTASNRTRRFQHLRPAGGCFPSA